MKSNSVTCRLCILLALLFCLFSPGFLAGRAFAQRQENFEITFGELGYDNVVLRGPVNYVHYYFSLPPDWEISSDASSLELRLDYTVSGKGGLAPALLEIELNGQVLQTYSFEEAGMRVLQVPLPVDLLRFPEDEYLNDLQFNLSVSAKCEEAQLTSLAIQSSSLLRFAYQEKPILLDLALFPRPFYRSRTFEPNLARLLLPADPSQTDVAAAVIVASGLGKLTGDSLALGIGFVDEAVPANLDAEHLLLIGHPEDITLLDQLELPLPVAERQLGLQSRMPALVAPGQVFSYTLIVENTSSRRQELGVQDQLPVNSEFLDCGGECQADPAGVLRWDVGQVAAGQQVSTVVTLRLDDLAVPGESVEHTASLIDDAGTVINVDTLVARVETEGGDQEIVSRVDKGSLFFVLDDHGVSEASGVLQLAVSPWSPRHAAVVVTGLTDEALLKAAQALSASSRFPGMTGPYAIIQAVQPLETDKEMAEDITLAALGYDDSVVKDVAADAMQYWFEVPSGWALTRESYVALHFSYGMALSHMSATLDLRLNNIPIGSVELDEAGVSGTWATFSLPTTPLLPGSNRLDVRVGIRIDDVCVDLRNSNLWLTIYNDSLMHLSRKETALALDLGMLPQPFSDVDDLSDVIFVLPAQPSVDELGGLMRLASRLGSAAGGKYFMPRVELGGGQEADFWKGYDVIAIGRPTRNPFITQLNDALPQPFKPGTDDILQRVDNVIYQLPPDFSVGYVQELVSPWDANHAILVTTGTTDKGVIWALDALTQSPLKWQLNGDLALVLGDKMRTLDIKDEAEGANQAVQDLFPQLTPQATATPMPTVTKEPATATPVLTVAAATPSVTALISGTAVTEKVYAGQQRPVWLIPLLLMGVVLSVAGVGLLVWQRRA